MASLYFGGSGLGSASRKFQGKELHGFSDLVAKQAPGAGLIAIPRECWGKQ